MSLKETLEEIEREGELRHLKMVMKQMRDMLAEALCCTCGDPLGHDDEIVSDDDDHTIHKGCSVG